MAVTTPSFEHPTEEIEFTIDHSDAKAFAIYRDRLYSRKEEAVVREYTTNAFDAMRQIGANPAEVEVQLPTAEFPYFAVRDKGPSLDFEGIKNTYTVYLKSPKVDNPLANGIWGLGSKSGFCKSNQFYITTWKDGVKTRYLAYIDDSKKGRIKTLEVTPSDEPTGLEVHIPVESEDFAAYIKAAQEVYRYFEVLPIIHGLPNDKPITKIGQRYLLTGITNGIEWKYMGANHHSVVIAADVGYPIPPAAIDRDLHPLIQGQLLLYTPSRSIEYTPSREALDLSTKTKQFLNDILGQIKQAIRIGLEAQLAGYSTYLDARNTAEVIRSRDEAKGFRNIDLCWKNVSLQLLETATVYHREWTVAEKTNIAKPSKTFTYNFRGPTYITTASATKLEARVAKLPEKRVRLIKLNSDDYRGMQKLLSWEEWGVKPLPQIEVIEADETPKAKDFLQLGTSKKLSEHHGSDIPQLALYQPTYKGMLVVKTSHGDRLLDTVENNLVYNAQLFFLGNTKVFLSRHDQQKLIPNGWKTLEQAITEKVAIASHLSGESLTAVYDYLRIRRPAFAIRLCELDSPPQSKKVAQLQKRLKTLYEALRVLPGAHKGLVDALGLAGERAKYREDPRHHVQKQGRWFAIRELPKYGYEAANLWDKELTRITDTEQWLSHIYWESPTTTHILLHTPDTTE